MSVVANQDLRISNQRFEKPHRSLRVEENDGRRKWRHRTPENDRRTYRSYMVARRDVHIQGACSMNDVHDRIVQLLKNMKNGKKIPKDIAVIGLNTLLTSSENSRESIKYLMGMLRANNKMFRKQENTFLFIPQNELYENNDIYCKIREKRVSISPVFASRLQILDVGIYHADFEF